ncbi:uncharacterized protein LOC134935989 isoform X1 [Pseudophryne corroboree]|uniref:uncharacterized protein LOC134935989 isoform X1 n=1 Tax=Pseudophryne corroboree TaxID=495146 RepID=UPI003081D0B5
MFYLCLQGDMQRAILLMYCYQGISWTSGYFCVHQPKALTVMENGSIYIDCTFTYDEDPGEYIQYRVHWRKTEGPYCELYDEEITDAAGNGTGQYEGRISRVQDPDNKRRESLTITGLTPSDGPIICCTGSVINLYTSYQYSWRNDYGTYLQFTGDRSISQLDELIAVPGAEVIIPCHYPQEVTGEVKKVTWCRGKSEFCSQDTYECYTSDQRHSDDRYSLVSFPTDVSLRIHRSENLYYTHYCCTVTTSNRTFTSRTSTELVIADSSSSSPFTVKQPNNITADTEGSVTLNCSYRLISGYRDRDILWVSAYWRVNSTSGPYVYHPHQDMVHPQYKGRTEITGLADLHIQGVQAEDSATYYCFLVIKLCENIETSQRTATHGEGTSLTVKGNVLEKELNLLIIGSASALGLLFILCVILIILMAKGILCKTKKRSPDLQMEITDQPDKDDGTFEEMPYCEISPKIPEQELADGNADVMGHEENEAGEAKVGEVEENLVYAKLNKKKLVERNPTQDPIQNEEIIYTGILSPAN